MLIHFALLIIVCCLAYLYRRFKPKSKLPKILFACLSILLVLFIGLRDINIGTDTSNYVAMHRSNGWGNDNLEIGFSIISNLVKIFTNKYYVFLIVISAISVLGVLYSAIKYDFDTEIFIYLYITSFCYIYSISAMRFFCALSIILFSLKYMIDKKTIIVMLFILLAMMFHTSALIFVPVYFLTRLKFNKTNIVFLVFLLAIITLVIELTSGMGLFDIEMFKKYSYIEQSVSNQIGPSLFINAITLILSFAFYGRIKDYKTEYEFFVKVLIVSTFLDFISIAYRSVWLFKFPTWFIIPIILKNIKIADRKTYILIYILTIISYGLYYYVLLKNSLPTHNLLHYSFNMELN